MENVETGISTLSSSLRLVACKRLAPRIKRVRPRHHQQVTKTSLIELSIF